MDREGEDARRSPEEVPDRVAPFEAAQRGTFPNRILGKQTGDPVGIVLVVAQRRIARLQVADRLRVLKRSICSSRAGSNRLSCAILSSPLFRTAKPWPLSP